MSGKDFFSNILGGFCALGAAPTIGLALMAGVILMAGACHNRVEQHVGVGDGTRYTNSAANSRGVDLPDGSHAVLKPGTQITVAKGFGASNRDLELDGEAIFEVTQRAGKPFVVHTRNLEIMVLGTWFHVDAFRKNAGEQVELLEGRLRVTKSYHSDTDNEAEVLEAGDMIMINRDIDLMEKEKMTPTELDKVKAMR